MRRSLGGGEVRRRTFNTSRGLTRSWRCLSRFIH
uniref:Uncharacterized protein n=1 Tax=Scylla paramamosain TaxID=85552 RepID=D2DT47_SCYPA|nr:hypothetical protein [Scylla paramamosain]